MEFINKVQIRGIVGRTNVLTYSDKTFVRISVVTNYVHPDNTIETTWFNVLAVQDSQNPTKDKSFDLTSIKKGDIIEVYGRLRPMHYTTADGTEHNTYDIKANDIKLNDKLWQK